MRYSTGSGQRAQGLSPLQVAALAEQGVAFWGAEDDDAQEPGIRGIRWQSMIVRDPEIENEERLWRLWSAARRTKQDNEPDLVVNWRASMPWNTAVSSSALREEIALSTARMYCPHFVGRR